jgi:hypothetical protein
MQLQAREFKLGLNVNKCSEVYWCGVNSRVLCEVYWCGVNWRVLCEVYWCGVNWRVLCEVEFRWVEVKWVKVKFLVDEGVMYIRFNLYWGYLIKLWLLYLGISWTVVVVTSTVVILTCFVMPGCAYVWVFVMCVSFGNKFTCIYCVLHFFVLCFCIASFMYMYSYLFCLYCRRVTTQLQLIIIIIIII